MTSASGSMVCNEHSQYLGRWITWMRLSNFLLILSWVVFATKICGLWSDCSFEIFFILINRNVNHFNSGANIPTIIPFLWSHYLDYLLYYRSHFLFENSKTSSIQKWGILPPIKQFIRLSFLLVLLMTVTGLRTLYWSLIFLTYQYSVVRTLNYAVVPSISAGVCLFFIFIRGVRKLNKPTKNPSCNSSSLIFMV